jgi:hypothetical protein
MILRKRKKSGLRVYRAGTFDKYVAYGQRDRKLKLVARGILKGFEVKCPSENSAKNLAYSLRLRANRIEREDYSRCGIKIKLDGRKIFAIGTNRPTK